MVFEIFFARIDRLEMFQSLTVPVDDNENCFFFGPVEASFFVHWVNQLCTNIHTLILYLLKYFNFITTIQL